MVRINEDLDVLAAETYESLGPAYAQQARETRLNIEYAGGYDSNPHAECTDSDALAAILRAVPDDDRKSVKHTDTCWQTHAACLRDKLYNDLGWE